LKEFIAELLENKVVLSLIYIVICLILIKILDGITKLIRKKKDNSIKAAFTKGVLEFLLIIFTLIKIGQMSNVMSKFASTILMSSSLLVVVLGFVFQEGLSNIIHGFIIAVFKPFEIGNRVEITVNGEHISGYVKSMTLRHTVVVSIIDNAEYTIPNSQLDNANIKNLTTQDMPNRFPITVSITYEDAQDTEKLQRAKKIFSNLVLENERTINKAAKQGDDLFVKVDLADSAVTLTCFIETHTAEANFTACSEIKERLLEEYKKADIEFAYNHLQLTGSVKLAKEED